MLLEEMPVIVYIMDGLEHTNVTWVYDEDELMLTMNKPFVNM